MQSIYILRNNWHFFTLCLFALLKLGYSFVGLKIQARQTHIILNIKHWDNLRISFSSADLPCSAWLCWLIVYDIHKTPRPTKESPQRPPASQDFAPDIYAKIRRHLGKSAHRIPRRFRCQLKSGCCWRSRVPRERISWRGAWMCLVR